MHLPAQRAADFAGVVLQNADGRLAALRLSPRSRGAIGFLDEAMSAYRIHAGGVWSQGLRPEDWWAGTPEQQTRWVRRLEEVVQLYEELAGHLGRMHRDLVRQQIASFAWRCAGVWTGSGEHREAWKSAGKAFARCLRCRRS